MKVDTAAFSKAVLQKTGTQSNGKQSSGVSLEVPEDKIQAIVSEISNGFMEAFLDVVAALGQIEPQHGGLGAEGVDVLNSVRIKATEVTRVKNRVNISVTLELAEYLHRNSVYPTAYPKGIDNIAALLNTGYIAKNRAYGTVNSLGSAWDGMFIESLDARPGSDFIGETINLFRRRFGGKYKNITFNVPSVYGIY